MHERETSDPAIGAGKSANKAEATPVADAAELVEQSEQPTRLEVWQGESPCTVNCLYSGG
jgi:hypothetical protein